MNIYKVIASIFFKNAWQFTPLFRLLRFAFAILAMTVAVQAQTFPTDKLTLVTSDGKRIEITVELAISNEARARGLMFRQNLDENKGMIFDFGEPESEAAMWMKNTFIPLDMIFIRNDGTIRTIAANTVPHSTDTVLSKGAVRAVLELKGGFATRNGLKEGDKVEFNWFKR